MADGAVGIPNDEYNQLVVPVIRDRLDYFRQKLPELIDGTMLNWNQSFTLADYGCFDGGSTQELIDDVISILREVRGPVFPINIIYEDQPAADFAPLIKTISAPKGTQRLPDNAVFVYIVPVSFYKQCTAPNTLNIIFCFWSAHFLSRKPFYKQSLYKFPYGTTEETKKVKGQAADDWENFLLQRSKEMKKGGVLMLKVPVTKIVCRKDGASETAVHLEGVWRYLTDVWFQLAEDQIITQDEYEAANYQGYYRNEEELRDPLEREDSPVYRSGLRLAALHIKTEPAVCKEKWMKALETADRGESFRKWIQIFVQTIRTWTEYVFIQGLSNRSTEKQTDILNTLYKRIASHICQLSKEELSGPVWDNIASSIVITKL